MGHLLAGPTLATLASSWAASKPLLRSPRLGAPRPFRPSPRPLPFDRLRAGSRQEGGEIASDGGHPRAPGRGARPLCTPRSGTPRPVHGQFLRQRSFAARSGARAHGDAAADVRRGGPRPSLTPARRDAKLWTVSTATAVCKASRRLERSRRKVQGMAQQSTRTQRRPSRQASRLPHWLVDFTPHLHRPDFTRAAVSIADGCARVRA